jgi:hypothetical protein
MEKQLPKTKRSEISDKLEDIEISDCDTFDLPDRTAVMQVAGELKRYKGLEFITSKKGQPEGKFAVWRVK